MARSRARGGRHLFDSVAPRANNAPVTPPTAHQSGPNRTRRSVALLALAAWTLSGFICPMPVHGMDIAHAHAAVETHKGASHEHGAPQGGSHTDLCCELLADSTAVAQSLAIPSVEKMPVGPFVAVASDAIDLSQSAISPTTILPRTNGPPRIFYQRFATFWSHAPPARHH